jgi:2-oxoglutarate dehydrogenase E2 component (dihydrolipoamide succinyltransferase)
VEIATDKVDSEVPSPVDGVLEKILFNENDVVAVGAVIAVIRIDGESEEPATVDATEIVVEKMVIEEPKAEIVANLIASDEQGSGRFYSPLVKSMARKENIALKELDAIEGSGENGRMTKHDLENFISNRQNAVAPVAQVEKLATKVASIVPSAGDEIIQMDRMRKLIADHMVHSKQTSAHVTSFIELDMGKAVNWREKNKGLFEKKYGTKLTYTHVILHAAAQALRFYPMVNASVDGDKIILKKNINIGMATALPNGNLIVPVLKNADLLNLAGVAKVANDLAFRARDNKLSPDEISGGTFTFTNLGSFGSLTGTPIINQPQVAILAAGVIAKKPVVIESHDGDSIGIRPIMILSLSYDHRIVDGALGGLFILKMKQLLESFEVLDI